MSKSDIELLLKKNGYAEHPVFGFYHIPKTNLGNYFYVRDLVVIVGKIKWGNINIRETRLISIKSFNPHTYNLVTDLDIKRIELTTQRMAKNRAKQKDLTDKGYSVAPEEKETFEG